MTDKNGTPIEVGTVLRQANGTHPVEVMAVSASIWSDFFGKRVMTQEQLDAEGWLVSPAPEPATIDLRSSVPLEDKLFHVKQEGRRNNEPVES